MRESAFAVNEIISPLTFINCDAPQQIEPVLSVCYKALDIHMLIMLQTCLMTHEQQEVTEH